MASGSYNGIGVKVPDLLLYAGLAVGAYFAWKTFFKPASKVTESVGGFADETFESYKAPSDTFQAGWNYLTSAINQATAQLKTGQSDNRQKQVDYNTISTVDTSNYVTKVTPAGSAYGVNLITVSTSKGQASTVAQKPNTYYPGLGIGFDSKNQGYSSLTPIKG